MAIKRLSSDDHVDGTLVNLGNVGIGTSGTANTVVNTTILDNLLTVAKADQALTFGSYWESGVGQYSYIKSSQITTASTASDLRIYTGSTEKMRITAAGLVGIGTTSPAGLLHVANASTGGIIVGNYNSTQKGIYFRSTYYTSGADQDYYITAKQNTLEFFKPASAASDSVGFLYDNIGSIDSLNPFWCGMHLSPETLKDTDGVTPTYPRLSMYHNYNTVTAAPTNLTFNITPGNSGSVKYSVKIDTANNGNILLTPNGTGGVGIGTTSPNSPLHVVGTSNFIASSGATYMLIDSLASEAAQIVFKNLTNNRWWISSNNDTRLYVLDANANDGVYIAQNATSWTANSDARLKDVIGPIENATAKVNALSGVKFTWKRDAGNPDAKVRVGLIAQDVLEVLPESVEADTPDLITDEETGKVSGGLGVRYTELVPLLVNAIKELTTRIATLEQRV